ncbi:MAG: cyclophane-forming radical SAM/SPASM peptide maturase GrrM/OscB [Desulfomonilaceae bacterium]|nr:cyclophane-forming radical SAM/SPASM peptide maturase GrrM/OscB [Desulfomonilaceae bacterium]
MTKNIGVKVSLLTLQATRYCNLRCRYCYVSADGKSDPTVMSDTTLLTTLAKLRDEDLLGERLEISWHSGEPLSAGTAFYDNAFAVIDRVVGSKTQVVHHFQTNATLIDRRWADFFRRRDVRVGVSLDGPRQLHDHNRKFRNGSGSHQSVMRGVDHLRRAGITPSVICVVTEKSLHCPTDIHDFFCEEGFQSISLNPEEIEGINTRSSLSQRDDWRVLYKRFMDLFHKRMKDFGNRLVVRQFSHVHAWLQEKCQYASGPAIPFNHLTVSNNGDFSTFSPELITARHERFGDFILGNVRQGRLSDAGRGSKFKRLWSEIMDGLLRCKNECPLFSCCGGGAPSNKLFENGSFASTCTIACEAGIRIPFEVVKESAENGTVMWKRMDGAARSKETL